MIKIYIFNIIEYIQYHINNHKNSRKLLHLYVLICFAQCDHSLEARKYSLTTIPNTIKYCGGTSAVSVARPFGAFGESVLRDFSAPTDNKKAQAQRELQRSASASEK